jgi:ribosome biogenesis GTPase
VTDDVRALRVLGWDDRWAEAASAFPVDLVPARVVAVDRAACDVLAERGVLRVTFGGELLEEIAKDPVAGPCTGDWALVRHWPDDRETVERLLPRRTAVVRASASRTSFGQVLAANVDVVVVVASLSVEPDLGRIERLLALAWESGAQPAVVLAKADLVTDAADIAADVAGVAPGVPVLVVSAVSGEGMSELADLAGPGRTLALLGQSGVGKSTLVNALHGTDRQAVSDIGAVGKGRHTTVRRELVALPGGGLLIDTPGLRGVGLMDVEEGLEQVFQDIEALAARCRFSDCSHATEPGCAVLVAVDEGELPVRRLESWRKLGREARWMAGRTDARIRLAEKARWKAIHKSARQAGVIRP